MGIWLLLAIYILHAGAQELTCFEEGECMSSLVVGTWTTKTSQECLEQCQKQPSCMYFTYYEEGEDCVGFANCETFLSGTCTNCFTGQRECQDLHCWEQFQCNGDFIDELAAGSNVECHQMCRRDTDCLWFTFNSQQSTCILLETCPEVDPSCELCVSGQMQCTTKKDETKAIIIAGFNSNSLSSVEVVDLEAFDNTCSSIQDYPIQVSGHTSALYKNKIMSCGGRDSYNYFNLCYEYDFSMAKWSQKPSMLEARYGAVSSIIDGKWLLSGGYKNVTESLPLDISEVWDGTSFSPGPRLPVEMGFHCQVSINSTHIFFADTFYTGNAYLLDWYSQSWSQLMSVPTLREFPQCGYAYNDTNAFVIVVAGDGTSDVFSLDSFVWTPGPPLGDDNLDRPASVQLQTTFLIMSGLPHETAETTLDEIWRYNIETNVFELLSQRLQSPRELATGVAVPDDFVNC